MILTTRKKAKIQRYIVQGEMEKYSEDKALANVMREIENSGVAVFNSLGVFAKGLKSRFEEEQLIADGKITPKGQEIARTGYAWKGVCGRFVLSILECENKNYLIGAEEYDNRDIGSYIELKNDIQLTDTYVLIKKNCAYKNCSFNSTVYKSANAEEVDLDIIYDYEKGKAQYACVDSEGDKTEFIENKEFVLVSCEDALVALKDTLENYGLNTLRKTVLINELTNNPLLENAVAEVFAKGSFNVTANDGTYSINGIKLNISKESVARELLLKYLITKAQNRYCGYSEVASLIAEFYGLFEKCPNINSNTQTIYSDLIDKAFKINMTAYLRLCAYMDMMPENIQQKYQIRLPKDFSNSTISVYGLVKEIVGNDTVKSVALLTKFAYKNARISRAINLFADALKRQYNVPLRLYTAKNSEFEQADVAKEFYEKLKNNPNIEFVEKSIKDIEKIHDRYYKIERESGDIEWVKMTGELDAFRYENDFIDGQTPNGGIDENTVASVKEMTIVSVKSEGIIPLVKDAMEGVK